eukprot:scaffold2801_cov266-Pinguiococcus_pyrenoidosus.AAC.4
MLPARFQSAMHPSVCRAASSRCARMALSTPPTAYDWFNVSTKKRSSSCGWSWPRPRGSPKAIGSHLATEKRSQPLISVGLSATLLSTLTVTFSAMRSLLLQRPSPCRVATRSGTAVYTSRTAVQHSRRKAAFSGAAPRNNSTTLSRSPSASARRSSTCSGCLSELGKVSVVAATKCWSCSSLHIGV